MKRTIALLLALAVAMPWSALAAGAGSPCAPAGKDAMTSCSSCRIGENVPESSLRPGCCRFTPRSEAAPIQANGVSPAPKPLQSPETPAAVVTCAALDLLRGSFAPAVSTLPPPSIHAPPTETTHLLI